MSNIELNPEWVEMLDSMLAKASGGALGSMSEVLDDLESYERQIGKLTKELVVARKATAPAKVAARGEIPSGEPVEVMANEVFLAPNGIKSPALAFPVLSWKWNGTHPDVPEVDPHYQWDAELLCAALLCYRRFGNLWLGGHTGTGKSTLVLQIAAKLGLPVTRVNLDGHVERADLIGEKVLTVKDGQTVSVFQEGAILTGISRPGVLLLDEVDSGRPDVLFALQRLLEDDGIMVLEDGGRLVPKHSQCMIAATGNSMGHGDEFGVYPSVRPMSAAMMDRFRMKLKVGYMDKDDEERLLTGVSGVADGIATRMVQFANDVRDAFVRGELNSPVTPRGLIAMAGSFNDYSEMLDESQALEQALKHTVISGASEDTRQRVTELASRSIGI